MRNKKVNKVYFVSLFSFFLLVILTAIQGWGKGRDISPLSDIGPATSTSNVTIASAGSGKKNCLTDLVVISTQAYTLRILDAGTTTFALPLAANTGFIKEWPLEASYCGSNASSMEIKVSAGDFNINYSGYVK